MNKLEELEKRIQGLEDLEAIKKLKARYAQLADEKYSDGMPKGEKDLEGIANEMTQLFTEDAVWDGGRFGGILKGRKEIYKRFKGANFNFAIHYFVMPHITINGDRAKGRWYMWEAATLTDGTPVWIAGFEDDEYTKINGQWLMSYLKFTLVFLTPYHQGWFQKK